MPRRPLSPEQQSATVNTSANKKLDLAIDGTVYNIALGADVATASNAAATKTDIANDITQQLAALGSTAKASVDNNNHLIITSGTKGADSSVQILTASANDAGATLGLTGSSAGQSRSGADLANAINQQLSLNTTLQGAQLQASFAGGQLTLGSQNGTYFQLNAYGAGATGGSSIAATSQNYAIVAATSDQLSFKVDGGATQTITLTAGGALSAGSVAADITAKLAAANITGVTASASGGHLELTSTAGSGHSIQVVTAATHDANAVLGFATTAANGQDANTGFGVSGASFTGNTAATAPAISQLRGLRRRLSDQRVHLLGSAEWVR